MLKAFLVSLMVLSAGAVASAQAYPPAPALAAYMKKNAMKINLTRVAANSRVFFVGEFHNDPKAKMLLASQLPALRKAGFTALALEMFVSTDQGLLDAFSNGQASPQQVAERLRTSWGWIPEAYVSLMTAAKQLGMKLLALDMDRNVTYSIEERDAHMASVLRAVLVRNPAEKIVTLQGGQHTQWKQNSQSQLLELQAGIPTSRVWIDWKNPLVGKNPRFPVKPWNTEVGNVFELTAIQVPVMIPFAPKQFPVDAFVFLP